MSLSLVVSNTAGLPLYEQIAAQIKGAILAADVHEGEMLPSIRALARDLRVSVITTTRAYQELVADGYVANVPGKGYFVLPRNAEHIRQQLLNEIDSSLERATETAARAGMTPAELRSRLDSKLAEKEER